jgi:hypothetical protein
VGRRSEAPTFWHFGSQRFEGENHPKAPSREVPDYVKEERGPLDRGTTRVVDLTRTISGIGSVKEITIWKS